MICKVYTTLESVPDFVMIYIINPRRHPDKFFVEFRSYDLDNLRCQIFNEFHDFVLSVTFDVSFTVYFRPGAIRFVSK